MKNTQKVTVEDFIKFIDLIRPEAGNPDLTHKVTHQLIVDSFAYNRKGTQKFNNEGRVKIPKSLLKEFFFEKFEDDSTDTIETTIGRFIFNYFTFFTKELRKHFGYINKTFDKKTKGFIEKEMSVMLVEDVIDNDLMTEFIDRYHWFAFNLAPLMATSLDYNTLAPLDNVNKLKEKKVKELNIHAKYDPTSYLKVQDELLDLAQKTLDEMDTPGIAIYNSGASKGFSNNYKNSSLARGLVPRSNDDRDMNISMASLVDGIPKEELHIFADIMTTASFNRAIGTQTGGYRVKIINSSIGHVVTSGKRDDDCGTKFYKEVTITKDNMMDFHLQYMRDGTKGHGLILLSRGQLKNCIGKTIEIRSPLFCTNIEYCSKCSGQSFNEFGSNKVGMLATKIGSAALNASLKAFHDMSVKTFKIELDNSFKKIKV